MKRLVVGERGLRVQSDFKHPTLKQESAVRRLFQKNNRICVQTEEKQPHYRPSPERKKSRLVY